MRYNAIKSRQEFSILEESSITAFVRHYEVLEIVLSCFFAKSFPAFKHLPSNRKHVASAVN